MFTKNKILAFVMLLAVAAPLFFFTCFLIKQKWMEHNMEEQLEKASLRTITVDATSIHWVKENKEVTINGKLFDVRSFFVKGSKIVLTGLYDNDEDVLNDQMKSFVQEKNTSNVPLSPTVFNLIFPPFYNNTATPVCQNTWLAITRHFVLHRAENILKNTLPILTPPPRSV